MSKKYKVIWSSIAAEDLKNIIEYIADENLLNAQNVFKKIKKTASSLHLFPDRGRIVPELKDQGITQYRELIIPPWRILYRISENKVYVFSVLDSHQNIEDILLQRLTNQKL